MTFSKSYYELLGVSRSADSQTLRRAFRRLSKALHPDTTELPKDEAAIKFQQVCEAYEFLSDPITRESYDLSLPNASSLENHPLNASTEANQPPSRSAIGVGERRPLSGGELFSLLLLGFALVISLSVGIGFALVEGRNWQVQPSWLLDDHLIGKVSSSELRDVAIATSSNSIESALLVSP